MPTPPPANATLGQVRKADSQRLQYLEYLKKLVGNAKQKVFSEQAAKRINDAIVLRKEDNASKRLRRYIENE